MIILLPGSHCRDGHFRDSMGVRLGLIAVLLHMDKSGSMCSSAVVAPGRVLCSFAATEAIVWDSMLMHFIVI